MTSPTLPKPETSASLPSPPFVAMQGIPNFREVANLPITNSPNKSLHRNLLFRCAEPTKATPVDIAKMRELGIAKVYDLRSLGEIEKYTRHLGGSLDEDGSPYKWEGIERVYAPVFREEAWDPASLAERDTDYRSADPKGMANAYQRIAEQGRHAYTLIVTDLLSSSEPTGILFHCTAGKDRTGVLAALLLSLSGVAPSDIVREFELTNDGLGSWMEFLVQVVKRQTGFGDVEARRLASARGESMKLYLEGLEARGGAVQYWKGCGFGDGEVERLRNLLVIDGNGGGK